jgi:hypothetical protein
MMGDVDQGNWKTGFNSLQLLQLYYKKKYIKPSLVAKIETGLYFPE